MMAVDYLWQYGDGTTGNTPYKNGDANSVANNGTLLGRADGYTGPIATSATPNQPQYSVNDGSGDFFGGSAQPMPLPRNTGGGAQLGGSRTTYGPNPYLQDQANGIQNQVNQNLKQNILPGIRSSALANGSFGSSRQGIAEGVAAGNASTGIAGALANLYGGAYNTDQGNQTSRMGIGANYSLGMTNAGNSAVAQNQNFYTQQRGLDLNQYQLGAGMYGQGISGQAGVGAGQYGVGQQGYQAPYTALQQYSNQVSPYTGLNSAQQIAPQGGNMVNNALGGALAGGQIYNNLGLNGSNIGGSAASTQNWSYGGSNPASNQWQPPSSASIESGWGIQ
jgi:hypothetical protein